MYFLKRYLNEVSFCASFSPNGSYVATGFSDGTIRVWRTRTRTRVGDCFQGHGKWVTSVAFSPDGKRMAPSSLDKTIRLWDVDSGTCVGISPKTSSCIDSVSFTGVGDRIVSDSFDDIVRIWDTNLLTEAEEKIDWHSDKVLDLQSVEMGRGWLPHQMTEPCDCGMQRLGTRSDHHWKVTLMM